MTYCHKIGFCHRDLKPENLLFDRDFQLKVADFGFSACIEGKTGDGKLYTRLGTYGYMAPEIHERRPYEGEQIDIFAAAIILFIMKSGTPPFTRATKKDAYYKLFLKKPDRFWFIHSKNKPGKMDFYSKDFRNLITKML